MKMIKISKVIIVDEEVSLKEFLESRSAYFEYIDKNVDKVYITDEYYPSESFILVMQELDSGELSMHELGYVLCPEIPNDLANYVKDHIDEYVELHV